jgi:hypothetical protein
MTPDPEQQPQREYYLLTRDDMEEFYDSLVHIVGKDYADTVWTCIENRSQSPHPPAPETLGDLIAKTNAGSFQAMIDEQCKEAYESGFGDGYRAAEHPPAPEHDCLCVSKCDPKNCGTGNCKCSDCWNPVTSLGCDGNWQQTHDAAIARAATLAENKRVLDELIDELPNVERSYGGEQIDTYIETHDLKELVDTLRQSTTAEGREGQR